MNNITLKNPYLYLINSLIFCFILMIIISIIICSIYFPYKNKKDEKKKIKIVI